MALDFLFIMAMVQWAFPEFYRNWLLFTYMLIPFWFSRAVCFLHFLLKHEMMCLTDILRVTYYCQGLYFNVAITVKGSFY
jgi:hypothetical protein